MSERWAPGGKEGEQRNLGLGGADLALASLNQDQMGRRPRPLSSCHVGQQRSPGHLESWKAEGWILQPPPSPQIV